MFTENKRPTLTLEQERWRGAYPAEFKDGAKLGFSGVAEGPRGEGRLSEGLSRLGAAAPKRMVGRLQRRLYGAGALMSDFADDIGRESKQLGGFRPTLYKWRNPSLISRRAFIGGSHLIRKFLSVTIATGGIGKSTLILADAVAMASGRKLHDADPNGLFRIWYWNGEDPREEIERRVAAIMKHYGVGAADIGDRLYFISGRDDGMEMIIASQTKHGTTIARPVEDALAEALIAGKFDVLMLDPFVATHRVSENDNMAIDAIAKTLGRIADEGELRDRACPPCPQDQRERNHRRGRTRSQLARLRGAIRPRPQPNERGRGRKSQDRGRTKRVLLSARTSARPTSPRPATRRHGTG